jgi:flagellar M-ring protein FliF
MVRNERIARQIRAILISEDLIPHTVDKAMPMVPVFALPVNDLAARDRIVKQINQEGVSALVTPNGIIMVRDENTARRMRAVLVREDLIPQGIEPWQLFNREHWTTAEFERNVNIQRGIQQMLIDHIRALEDVDNVWVNIAMPTGRRFQVMEPVTVSVILTPKPESDIAQSRKKIEGIQKLLKYAIEGLKDENIVITDQTGLILNDFDGIIIWLPEWNVQEV